MFSQVATAEPPTLHVWQLACAVVTLDSPFRALITGAGGFVGPHLLSHLADSGDDAIGADLTTGPNLLDPEGWVEFVASVRPQVIFHLAGWSDVGSSWTSPTQTQRVNAEGTLNVLDAARLGNVDRVVIVSSADLYGTVNPNDLPLTESAPVRPNSPYGASKQSAEAIAAQYVRGWGLDVVIARPFNHIGRGQSVQFAVSAFADRVARCEHEGGGVVRHGDLSARRDLTDVRDVVRAYRLLALSGTPGEAYNICSGSTISMQEVLDHLINHSDADIRTQTDPALLRPVELPILLGSHAKLTADTGWSPQTKLAETLADVLEDARNRLTLSLKESS